MSESSSPISLFDTRVAEPKEARLHHRITDKQLLDWEGEWKPELYHRYQELKRAGVDRSQWPGTANKHWDWRRKVAQLQSLLSHAGFCITCDGMTEGMMLVDTVSNRCRIPDQKGFDLVYIDYVENAPWNRPEFGSPPRFRGIGSILVRAAIERSLAEEFKGRIGLHSLPQAEDLSWRLSFFSFSVEKVLQGHVS